VGAKLVIIFDIEVRKKYYFCSIFVLVMKLLVIILQMTIMTYNVENLFDTQHDTLKNDYEYMPQSGKQWTKWRYYKKVNDIMRTIVSAGEEGEWPMLVGLCEIENDSVLRCMTEGSRYKKLGYQYVHYESPDERGIDVALLYRRDMFTPLLSRPVGVVLPDEKPTRDLLYVCGTLKNGTILHVIQAHMPSRRGGTQATEKNRMTVAEKIKVITDSIFAIEEDPAIIIMGDMNDNPDDKAIEKTLGVMPTGGSVYESGRLYNLVWDGFPVEGADEGSYYHSGEWERLDQIIVSGALLNGRAKVQAEKKAEVFDAWWLQSKDGTPKRTYLGDTYQGGASDHFPVKVGLTSR